MKNIINTQAFNQEEAFRLNLDLKDLAIINWFIDFINTDSSKQMHTEIIKGRRYFFVKYEKIIEDLPIIKISKNQNIGIRFKKWKKSQLIYFNEIKKPFGTVIACAFNQELLFKILIYDGTKKKLLERMAVPLEELQDIKDKLKTKGAEHRLVEYWKNLPNTVKHKSDSDTYKRAAFYLDCITGKKTRKDMIHSKYYNDIIGIFDLYFQEIKEVEVMRVMDEISKDNGDKKNLDKIIFDPYTTTSLFFNTYNDLIREDKEDEEEEEKNKKSNKVKRIKKGKNSRKIKKVKNKDNDEDMDYDKYDERRAREACEAFNDSINN